MRSSCSISPASQPSLLAGPAHSRLMVSFASASNRCACPIFSLDVRSSHQLKDTRNPRKEDARYHEISKDDFILGDLPLPGADPTDFDGGAIMLFAVPENLFRVFARGDIKCVLDDTRFPLERNQSGAYIDPAFFARLGDDLDFVAVRHLLSAETCSRTLLK